ncbi:PLP-dependent transferase [Atractiella rhizophila]|nr:PLP-dependent transferase [Atractiella rhizophila]
MAATTTQLLPSARSLKNTTSPAELSNLVPFDDLVASKAVYDQRTTPDGLINVFGAKSYLMLDWVKEWWSKEQDDFEVDNTLPYGNRFGSDVLKQSLANIFNGNFQSKVPVKSEEIIITCGTTPLINLLGYTLFESGDAVMMPCPNFSGFQANMEIRNDVELVKVPTDSDPQIEDQFAASSSDAFISAFDRAYNSYVQEGGKIKAVLTSNPNNPSGRCYSGETLKKLIAWCTEKKIHFISDEIYGLSSFASEGMDTFTRVLSLVEEDSEEMKLGNIHAFWGASKDLGMGGLRAGFFVTRNRQLLKVLTPLQWYVIPTHFTVVFLERFLSSSRFNEYVTTFRARLEEGYKRVTSALREKNIPFHPSNSGLYIWLDLSQWSKYFEGGLKTEKVDDGEVKQSKQVKLLRWIVEEGGVYFPTGEEFHSNLDGHYRFVYTADISTSVVLVDRLRKCLDKLEKEKKIVL